MKSLRHRLSWLLLTSLGTLLVLVAGISAWQVGRWQEKDLDRTLLARAQVLVSLTTVSPKGEIGLAEERIPQLEPDPDREYFQLWTGDGRIIERSVSLSHGERLHSESLPGNHLEQLLSPSRDLPRDVVPSQHPRFRDALLPDGRSGRLVQVDFLPSSASTAPAPWPPNDRHRLAVLVVAKSRQRLDSRQRTFTMMVAATCLVLMSVVALSIHWSLHLGLRPLRRVTDQMEGLGARNLQRLQLASSPQELKPIVEQLNALLERLEQAFERERRLSSNMAHELRTPIAELRNLAEVGTRWPNKRDMVMQFFADVEDISAQMETTVVQLLALARYESGLEVVRYREVDVSTVIDEAWRPQAREAAKRGISLSLEVTRPLLQRTDPDKLQLMLTNLLSNAVAYSPPHSSVRTVARQENGGWILVVINPAAHLRAEDLPLLFDRFWRKDPARTGGQHNGLGLSLVRAFGELLDIAIQAKLDDRGCLHIELRFPQRPPPASLAEMSALRVEPPRQPS